MYLFEHNLQEFSSSIFSLLTLQSKIV